MTVAELPRPDRFGCLTGVVPSHHAIDHLSRWPIVISPMAGGPTVPALVVAGAEAGALAFLAGGYKSPAQMRSEIEAVRAGTNSPFGVNLFVPGTPTPESAALATYVRELEPLAVALGVEIGPATWDDDGFAEKVDVLVADPPAVVSFTFGCPPTDVLDALQERSVVVAVTVTTADEAALGGAVRGRRVVSPRCRGRWASGRVRD